MNYCFKLVIFSANSKFIPANCDFLKEENESLKHMPAVKNKMISWNVNYFEFKF